VVDAGVLLAGGDVGPGGAVGDFPVFHQGAGVGGVVGHGDLGRGGECLVALVVGVEHGGGATRRAFEGLQCLVAGCVGESAGGGAPQHAAGRDQLRVGGADRRSRRDGD